MEPQPGEERALGQSDPLLRFAAENLKDLSPQSVQDIQAAWGAHADGTWSPEIAQRFWIAFNAICTAISPVTVESIMSNEPSIQRRSWRWRFGADQWVSLSARTAKRFLWLMLALLAGAVVLGYVVNTTASLRSDVQTIQAQDAKDIAKIASDFSAARSASQDWERKTLAAAPDPRASIQLPTALSKQFIDIDAEIHDLEVNQNRALQDVQLASIITYWGWNTYHFKPMNDELGEPNGDAAIVATIDQLSSNEEAIKKYIEDSWLMVSIISSMILPVILGAMGACAYVVRLIADQIKTSTFLPTSRIRDVARVALGALAGVVIGYGFAKPDGAVISQAALAFLAGYALDPVFAIFDKIAQSLK